MPFNSDRCAIPTVWCGKGAKPQKRGDSIYTKVGTRTECMKKGFGAGTYIERNKGLSKTNLQNIKYVGEEYERRFKKRNVKNLKQLIDVMSKKSPKQIETFLKAVFARPGGGFDGRSYNSTLLFLFRHGNGKLPICKKL